MIFAKPQGGFRWAVTDKVKDTLNELQLEYPSILDLWQAIKERLIHTGAREGVRIKETGDANVFLFTLQSPHELFRLQLVYTIKGDTLTVQSVRAISII